VLAARAEDSTQSVTSLRRLGPDLAPGQMLLVLDEVLTRAPGQGQFQELRTACLLTADGRRYLSGRGLPFLRQVYAAVQTCCDQSLLVVADGAGWIRCAGWLAHPWLKARDRAVDTAPGHRASARCAQAASVGWSWPLGASG